VLCLEIIAQILGVCERVMCWRGNVAKLPWTIIIRTETLLFLGCWCWKYWQCAYCLSRTWGNRGKGPLRIGSE